MKKELKKEKIPEYCPDCLIGRIRKINGKYGVFFGCSNYPVCDRRYYSKEEDNRNRFDLGEYGDKVY